jgi:hypothetical protein
MRLIFNHFAKKSLLTLMLSGAVLFLTGSSPGLTAPDKTDERAESDARAALASFIQLNNQGKLLESATQPILGDEAKTWHVATLGKLTTAPDKLQVIDDTNMVARVQWLDKNKNATDYYFYLSRTSDDKWRVQCCRNLSSVGIVEEAHKKLSLKKRRSAEDDFQLRNTALVVSSDAQLHKWFDLNRAKLDTLATDARALPKPYPTELKASDKAHPKLAAQIAALGLSSLALHSTGEMQVIIGGVNRDFVGLLNAPNGKRPQMSEKTWIWIEDFGGNWYFFKHT